MPKCPKCNHEITHLVYHNEISGYENGSYHGDCDYKVESSETDFVDCSYVCPACDEELFTATNPAKEFLSK